MANAPIRAGRGSGLLILIAMVVLADWAYPSRAFAGWGCFSFSTKPAYIDLVGTHAGTPDPAGTFTVVIRDFNNVSVPNAQVVVDFIACTDMTICSAVVNGKIIDCPTKTIRGFSDGMGRITFNIVGAGRNVGNAAGPGAGCANIIANGCSLIHPTVTVFDQNGAIGGVGVGGSDLAAWISDFGSVGVSGYKGRSDYNHDGALGGGDLSAWISRFGAGTSSGGCFGASYCP